MSENNIRISIRLLFRTQFSYLNIYNLRPVFWINIYEYWCEHLTDESKRTYYLSNLRPVFWINIYEYWCKHFTDESKRTYDLSNHIKVSTTKER